MDLPQWESFELQQLLRQLQQQKAVDMAQLFEGTGLTYASLRAANSKVTIDQERQLYARIANSNTDPLLALKHGQSMGVMQCGLLGQVMQSSETLYEALHVLARYPSLFSWQMQLKLQQHVASNKAVYQLLMVPCPSDECTNVFEVESTFATFKRMVEELSQRQVAVAHLTVKHRMADDVKQHFKIYFDCTVVDQSNENALYFPKDVLAYTLPYGDTKVKALLLAQCAYALRELTRLSGFHTQVVAYFAVCDQLPSIEQCATYFCLSSRTLRRRLAAAGTSYQQLLDQHRYQQAQHYLLEPTRSVESVAYTLGFRDARSLRAAFKRWSGESIQTYRSRYR